MSLSLEERREARRRKILENSDNRLAKILNKEDNTGDEKPSATKVIEKNHSLEATNSASIISDEPIENQECDHSKIERLKEELPLWDTVESKDGCEGSFVYERKYFVVLAVLIYVILINGGGFLLNNSMILPFMTISILKQTIVYKTAKSTPSLFLQVLVLNGLHPSLSFKLYKLGKIFYEFFIDFCVYFFSFIIFHLVIDCLKSS